MIRIILIVVTITLFFTTPGFSQNISATTEDGRKVILKKDGTYSFVESPKPLLSPGFLTFQKPDKSKTVFKPKGDRFLIWYDASLWHEKKTDSEKPEFSHKDGDVGAIIIAERVQLTLEAFRDIALKNARAAAPDARIIQEETRVVNGKSILCLKIQGTTQGIEFIFYGYYYAGKAGVIQHLTYAPINLYSEYEKDMTDFLNGLVIQE
ncbi:MAG TPA: hypothetical protein VK564_04465 [Thermodesulfobacteriota bacterium]|nr:hypothetical protein [Thermodesulfobacteriota bacterium]